MYCVVNGVCTVVYSVWQCVLWGMWRGMGCVLGVANACVCGVWCVACNVSCVVCNKWCVIRNVWCIVRNVL